MTRFLPLLLLCCHTDRLTTIEAETVELRTKVAAHERRLEETRAELAQEVDDARKLALVGGPVPRYRVGVKCKDGPFEPGSVGECAHRALWDTGWCDDQILPTREQHRAVLVSR